MSEASNIAGSAALTICESLLLALNDRHVLPEKEIMGILKSAAATLETNGVDVEQHAQHSAAAALIRTLIAGGNSVRRP